MDSIKVQTLVLDLISTVVLEGYAVCRDNNITFPSFSNLYSKVSSYVYFFICPNTYDEYSRMEIKP